MMAKRLNLIAAVLACTALAGGLLRFAGPALKNRELDAARAERIGTLKGRLVVFVWVVWGQAGISVWGQAGIRD